MYFKILWIYFLAATGRICSNYGKEKLFDTDIPDLES